MSAARNEILDSIRWALRDVSPEEGPEEVAVERDYVRSLRATMDELVNLFVERVDEYRAVVTRVPERGLPAAISSALGARRVQRLAVPIGLPAEWLPDGVLLLRDGEVTAADLDGSDAVLTGCALGIAQTGTIALDGGPRQGGRALTLLPDYHLCIVYGRQVVGTVPEAIERLADAAREGRPITFISGPSATSDIEFNRVEGVHGPRTLHMLVVEDAAVG